MGNPKDTGRLGCHRLLWVTGSRNKRYNELRPDGVEAGGDDESVSVREGRLGVPMWRQRRGEVLSGQTRAPRFLAHFCESHWVSYLYFISCPPLHRDAVQQRFVD